MAISLRRNSSLEKIKHFENSLKYNIRRAMLGLAHLDKIIYGIL